MINKLLNKVKEVIGVDELSIIKYIHNNYELCKSEIDDLHARYNIIEDIEDKDIKKSFEDAHFDDIEAVYRKGKELSLILSKKLNKYQNTISKADYIFRYKDKLKDSLGKKRHEMPQVKSDNLDDFISHFDNKVGVKEVKRKVSQLKPSQSEISEDKVKDLIINYFGDNENKPKYIISNDNYLLDGHHRWAAELEVNKDAEVDCLEIDLPADKLIKQANKLKMTKTVDIDDETFVKAVTIIALAKAEGFLSEDLLNLVKARNAGLIPVQKTVMRGGRAYSQTFWVSADSAESKRNTTIKEEDLKTTVKTKTDYSSKNESKNSELFKRQKEDDSIANVGDKVDVNYLGRSSREKFSFKDLEIVDVSENTISVKINEDISSNKKYKDGTNISFRKGAVLIIPKHNSKDWSENNNYTLKISEEDREERLKSVGFLENLRNYAKKAKEKGYSVFEDAIEANEKYIEAKYAPFFAKYGKSFDPIKMFDDCKEIIKNHFGDDVYIRSEFRAGGFSINVRKDGIPVMTTERNFIDHTGYSRSLNKGIYHALFKIHNKKNWGGGLAKKLFCAYYNQYKKMGLQFLSVTAGLQSGPYVWPSFGFYGNIEQGKHVLSKFKEGASRDISSWFPDQHDENVEKAYSEDGRKIFIKYKDKDEPVDVSNETIVSSKTGETIKKYGIDRDGYVIEPDKSVIHTITKEESDRAKFLFEEFIRENPEAKIFPNTIFTSDEKLKQASKVAFLNAGGAGYFVDLTNEKHREDFERQIKYNEYKKERGYE